MIFSEKINQLKCIVTVTLNIKLITLIAITKKYYLRSKLLFTYNDILIIEFKFNIPSDPLVTRHPIYSRARAVT